MANASPTRQALAEALELSGEILRSRELSELPLSAIALKASRLARLLNDTDTQKMMAYEAGGYSSGPGGLPQGAYELAVRAGRRTKGLDQSGKTSDEFVWTESIQALESQIEANKIVLTTIKGGDGNAQATNIWAGIVTPSTERHLASSAIAQAADRLASGRKLVYDYALHIHYELRYSGIAEDIFTRIRG